MTVVRPGVSGGRQGREGTLCCALCCAVLCCCEHRALLPTGSCGCPELLSLGHEPIPFNAPGDAPASLCEESGDAKAAERHPAWSPSEERPREPLTPERARGPATGLQGEREGILPPWGRDQEAP